MLKNLQVAILQYLSHYFPYRSITWALGKYRVGQRKVHNY